MTTWMLIKLGVRLLAFVAVFWFATRRNPKVVIKPRWALPLVAGLFAAFNTGLYWLLAPLLNLATFGAAWFVMPLVINGLLLYATTRLVAKKQWLTIDGLFATGWLALVLTVAHGLLWAGLDWLPPRL